MSDDRYCFTCKHGMVETVGTPRAKGVRYCYHEEVATEGPVMCEEARRKACLDGAKWEAAKI